VLNKLRSRIVSVDAVDEVSLIRMISSSYSEYPNSEHSGSPSSNCGSESGEESRQLAFTPPRSRGNSKEEFQLVEYDVIRCICACIALQVQKSVEDKYVPSVQYECFNKPYTNAMDIDPSEYSLEAIQFIFTIIHKESQMEYECMIITLIYLERLARLTNNAFRVCELNWRYILFTCMMLASKIWDDFAMINGEYATIFTNLKLSLINQLELEALKIFNFSLAVSNVEYTSYHAKIQDLVAAAKVKMVHDRLAVDYFMASDEVEVESIDSYSWPASAESSAKFPGTLHKNESAKTTMSSEDISEQSSFQERLHRSHAVQPCTRSNIPSSCENEDDEKLETDMTVVQRSAASDSCLLNLKPKNTAATVNMCKVASVRRTLEGMLHACRKSFSLLPKDSAKVHPGNLPVNRTGCRICLNRERTSCECDTERPSLKSMTISVYH